MPTNWPFSWVEYSVVRFSEKQSELMETTVKAAHDGVSGILLLQIRWMLDLSRCLHVPMLEQDCRGKPVVISSNSQVILRALEGYLAGSREVLRCRKLSTANSVSLLWVPGYLGVIGNKHADRLAKDGLKAWASSRTSSSRGLEPFSPMNRIE